MKIPVFYVTEPSLKTVKNTYRYIEIHISQHKILYCKQKMPYYEKWGLCIKKSKGGISLENGRMHSHAFRQA